MSTKPAGKVLLWMLISLWLTACSNNSSNGNAPGGDNNPGDEGNADIQLERIFPDLGFNQPVWLLPHPGDDEIWYLLEQRGQIYRLDAGAGTSQPTVNLADFYPLSTCGECGLLGMAFHPEFGDNGIIYLSFTEDTDEGMVSFVSTFVSPDDGLSLARDPDNTATLDRSDLVSVAQDFSNHNGGHIAFGPDGFLYYGLGDGGSGNDPNNRAQDTQTLLGSMLRLTAAGDPAPGNAVSEGDPRIYAYGLRNPWRWSFDRQTGELWAGDVGQNLYEEIDIIVNGGNYGWRCREGMHQTTNTCTTSGPYIDPVAEYGRDEGISVTGGYVYRGGAIPGLDGVYLFADFGSGNIWGLFPADNNGYERRLLLDSGLSISSFAEDSNGEVIVLDYGGGLYRIVSG